MNNKIFKFGIALLAVGVLVTPAAAQQFKLTVAHGIPGGDVDPSLDPALPVDVLVNGQICLLEDFRFGEFAGPLELDAGTYDIEIKLANASDPCSNDTVIGPASVPFEAGENATVIAHLDDAGGLTASKFVIDKSAVPAGKGRVIVHHTANAPAVDIKLRRGISEVVVPDFANGDQAAAEVRPGNYDLTIGPAGQNIVVFGPAKVRFKPFQAAEVYAVGSLANGTFTLLRNDSFVKVDFRPLIDYITDRGNSSSDYEGNKLAERLRSFFNRFRGLFG